MGVSITITDNEFPISPVFVDYVATVISGGEFAPSEWHNQLSEELSTQQAEVLKKAQENAARVMDSELGKRFVGRSYELFLALLSGDVDKIRDIQFRFHFINVIGVPRNGGSYLTKEIYRALGFDPEKVPNVIAHDGFPEASPFLFQRHVNSWVTSLQTMAEFLAMIEHYFGRNRTHSGKIQVPKKLTKGTYAGGFFHRILGESVEHILTVRHPVTSCISTYEKSGGLPEDGRFRVRSNIEEWVRRDLAYTGSDPEQIGAMGYFEAYLRYWEQYHYYVATTGLSASRNVQVVAYGQERMEDLARQFYYRYNNRRDPEPFQVFAKRDRHPEWFAEANAAVERVAAVWQRVGLEF
ncbi:MAG TPA: hypothetical protein VIX81_04965, partial [Gammaproteobacteria bacterium]